MYETAQQLKDQPPVLESRASGAAARLITRVVLVLSVLLTAVGLLDILDKTQPFARFVAVSGLVLTPTCLLLHLLWRRQVEIVPEPKHGVASVYFPFVLGSVFFGFHAMIQFPLLDRWIGLVCILPALGAYFISHVKEISPAIMRPIVVGVFSFTWLLAALVHINCALAEPTETVVIGLVKDKELTDGGMGTKSYWLVLDDDSSPGATRRLKVDKEVYQAAVAGEPIKETRASGLLDLAWTKSVDAVSVDEWKRWKAAKDLSK